MINLEQVKLLETKVAKAVDYVEHLAKENTTMHRQETELQTRLESYQKRIDELEILVMGFKEDQNKIEEGILAALDKLSQFEKAMEKSLREKPAAAKTAVKDSVTAPRSAKPPPAATDNSGNGQTCFEIPEASAEAWPDSPSKDGDDISDPLENTPDKKSTVDAAAEGGELDIF